MKKLAVSFKGGMARGLGSIGLMRYLQEEGIKPDYYAGSSSGGLIAAAFAMNYTWDRVLDDFKKVKITRLISLPAFVSKGAIISKKKFLKSVSDSLGMSVDTIHMKNMPNKLFLFASNLKTEQRLIIHSGNLGEALMKTCSYPLVLERAIESAFIIDGDFTSSYSASYLRKKGADVVIGSGYKPKRREMFSLNPVNTLISTYRLVSDQIDRYHDLTDPVDFEIEYTAEGIGYMDFKKIDLLVDRVYKRAKANADKIHKLLK